MTVSFFVLLVRIPFWVAFVPAVVVVHRVGVLLHEYFHGIPFRKYRYNLAVVTILDGLLLMFGMFELFRGTHLAHHRWLNTELDSAKETAGRRSGVRVLDMLASTEAVQHVFYLVDALRGKKTYISAMRILLGTVLSFVAISCWHFLGHPEIVWRIFAITIFTSIVPVSLRGAIEHHSYPNDPNFANEYKVWIPLFHLNRHIHHHEEPTLPWYLLQFRTSTPLSHWNYFTCWFQVYVRREFVLMQPMPGRPLLSKAL